MLVYKYLTEERFDVLENSSVRFTQPSALNDPFDTMPDLEEVNDEIVNRFMSDPEKVERLFSEISRRGIFTVGFMVKLAWLRETKHPNYREILKLFISKSVNYQVKEAIAENNDVNYLVLSLSKRKDNLLMWSHYANSHMGYVIGFDADKLRGFLEGLLKFKQLHDVLYSEKRYVVPRDLLSLVDIHAVRGIEGIKSAYFDRDSFVKGNLLRKSRDWFYEEEVRFFAASGKASSSDKTDLKGYKVFLFKFPKDAIVEIIAGANMSESARTKLKKIQEDKFPQSSLLRAYVSSKKFSVLFDSYESEAFSPALTLMNEISSLKWEDYPPMF